MPRASQHRSPAAQRHADTVRFVHFEARPASLAFKQLVRSSELSPHQARAGLACRCGTITEREWPPLIWTKADGYRFCSEPHRTPGLRGRGHPREAHRDPPVSSPASPPRTQPCNPIAGGSDT